MAQISHDYGNWAQGPYLLRMFGLNSSTNNFNSKVCRPTGNVGKTGLPFNARHVFHQPTLNAPLGRAVLGSRMLGAMLEGKENHSYPEVVEIGN